MMPRRHPPPASSIKLPGHLRRGQDDEQTRANRKCRYQAAAAPQHHRHARGRGGEPIALVAAGGGAAERVTFQGSYNVSPAVSPDGRWLAYISRDGGFRLHVMELATGQVTALTTTSDGESPSFAPNSKLIIYATRTQGGSVLMTTTLDGRIKATLVGTRGEVREPAWGPFAR